MDHSVEKMIEVYVLARPAIVLVALLKITLDQTTTMAAGSVVEEVATTIVGHPMWEEATIETSRAASRVHQGEVASKVLQCQTCSKVMGVSTTKEV